MTLKEISQVLSARVLCGDDDALNAEVTSACGSDMMSDVLAYVKDQGILLTGLINPQVVRTALMMDMKCICFVRGKQPDEKILEIARENGIVVLSTDEFGLRQAVRYGVERRRQMTDLVWDFEVDGGNFELAGSASQTTKSRLKQLGLPNETVRKVIIAMYEGEINMVIHADGGVATVTVGPKEIKVVLKDTGKGIENIPLAMKEGYSTASSEIRDLGFGAGMGLPNMKKYSDEMDIQSTVGVGTTITMKFAI